MHETIFTEHDAVKVIQGVLQASPFPCIFSSELSTIKKNLHSMKCYQWLKWLNGLNGLKWSKAIFKKIKKP